MSDTQEKKAVPRQRRRAALVVAGLGIAVALWFGLADAMGFGDRMHTFGWKQGSGVLAGVLLAVVAVGLGFSRRAGRLLEAVAPDGGNAWRKSSIPGWVLLVLLAALAGAMFMSVAPVYTFREDDWFTF